MSERVGNDEVNTDGSVKDEAASASGIVAEGDKVHQVIKQCHGDVEADSIPEETLGFSIETGPVEGASDEEGDDDDALEDLVDSVGAHLVQCFSEAVGGQALPFLGLEGEDVGLDPEPIPLRGGEVLFIREFFLDPFVVEKDGADEEVEGDDRDEEVEKDEEDLDVLVGIVLGSIVLAVKVHRLHHLGGQVFEGAEGHKEESYVQIRGEVEWLLHPVSSPLEALLLGLRRLVGVVAVVVVVLVHLDHDDRDPNQAEGDADQE